MTEACDKEEVAPSPNLDKDEVVRFARVLLSLVNIKEKRAWFTERGVNYDDYRKSNLSLPRWQQAFLSLVFMEFTKGNEFIEFNGEERSTPSYEVMEYKRDQSDSLPIEGYGWTCFEGKNIVLEIDYSGFKCWINAYHNNDDQELVTKLLKTIKKQADSMDYLRGEKLLITSRNRIKFFKFKETTKESLILPDKIWELIEINLITYLRKKQELKNRGLEWRRGILIWGPPGTGKTLLGKYLCTTLKDETILWVTPKCVGDSEDVEKLFELARTLAPTIIFIEDLDFFAANRDTHGLHPILGELLTQLDGISSNEGVFVIGTTNNQTILDKAIASRPSRFDVRMEIGRPEQRERKRLFELFTCNEEPIDCTLLASRSTDFSAAHIKEACTRGILSEIRNKSDLEKSILAGIDEIREEELNKPPPSGLLS